MGRRIYHMTWDFQDEKKTLMRNLPQEMRCPKWELINNEMGRRVYHMKWDFQDEKWQVIRWEDEFITGDGISKMKKSR